MIFSWGKNEIYITIILIVNLSKTTFNCVILEIFRNELIYLSEQNSPGCIFL